MDDNNTNIKDDHEETEEESLSLRDFPLTNNEQPPKSSFESNDYFEFFTDFTQISHADDIFISGKLIPFNQQIPSLSNSVSNHSQIRNTTTDSKLQSFHQRRSESLSELKSNRSDSTKAARFVRNSRSLDYRRLNRNSSMSRDLVPEMYRNSGKSDSKVVKPLWCILTFGLVKFPPEMDLQDMKNRQLRRNNSINLFPDTGSEVIPVNRSEKKCSSKLLRVLSCKSRSSVAVTASYQCIQEV